MNPIAKMLIEMARFYDQALDPRQVEMYVDVLSQFPTDQVLEAGKAYIRNPKNTRFPIPPHKILADMMPQVEAIDIARHTSGRVLEAVVRFGWPGSKAAAEYIGEAGWRVVGQFGGWQYICENLGVTLPNTVFLAQCRDAVEAEINLQKAGLNTKMPAHEQLQRGGLPNGNVSAIVKSLVDAKNLNPKGGTDGEDSKN